jgi:hypothetical protein
MSCEIIDLPPINGTKLTSRVFRPDPDYTGSKEPRANVIETATFAVGKKFTCELTFNGDQKMECKWSPHLPQRGELSKANLRTYQAERDKLYQRVANRIGGTLLLID